MKYTLHYVFGGDDCHDGFEFDYECEPTKGDYFDYAFENGIEFDCELYEDIREQIDEEEEEDFSEWLKARYEYEAEEDAEELAYYREVGPDRYYGV